MGYMHIDNLYKYPHMLLFKEVYALEKIHGTSAHISWKDGKVSFFSGGESHERFLGLFDTDIATRFQAIGHDEVTVYGEAYGGKQQGMSGTYGKELKFIVFDVKVGDCWLSVPNAEDVAIKLELEFVDYVKCETDLKSLDRERDRDSVQAARNGVGMGKLREGVVLRPLIELTKNDGTRIICKYKGEAFSETRTKREVDPKKLKTLENATAIAEEWVTPMRLEHVLDKLPEATEMKHTGDVAKAIVDDVKREAEGEVEWSKDVERAIGRAAAKIYKAKLTKVQFVNV